MFANTMAFALLESRSVSVSFLPTTTTTTLILLSKMSAAAARRRKQLAARKQKDAVSDQLESLLQQDLTEATAYEALQLAQSQVRKKVHAQDFSSACELAYTTSLALLKAKRVSVASQLLTVLVHVLQETHTEETDEWLTKLETLQSAHSTAMDETLSDIRPQEALRLHRLQRDWLRQCCQWSSDLGSVQYGHNRLQYILGLQLWKIGQLLETTTEDGSKDQEDQQEAKGNAAIFDEEEDEKMEVLCEAIQHMALAERPDCIIEWLKTLPAPTDEETAVGHKCPPALRDGLLTRAILLLCALENLRDANTLIRSYIAQVETRNVDELAKSYTNKEDGKAPSHTIFACMLIRICEKDVRTGPLYSWLMRSFKRELEGLYKPQQVLSYTTKIGKIYFHIQPPPTTMNMLENMMNMMGGGGGAPGGMNPAMMQAALAQMQGGMM